MRQQHNQSIPRHDDPPLPVDPGHVRTRSHYALYHYEAVLRNLQKEKAER